MYFCDINVQLLREDARPEKDGLVSSFKIYDQ